MSADHKAEHLNQEAGQEIRVKDLFLDLLHHWKSILPVAVACAMILGGWQAVHVNAAHSAGEKTREEQRYERDLASHLDTLEKCRKNVSIWKNRLNEKYAYRDGSILMNLDPGNVWRAEKKYIVAGRDGSASEILAVYTGAMGNGHDEAELTEAFGTGNAGYVNEVVEISPADGENAFRVVVYAPAEEMAAKGLEYVRRKVEAAESRAQEIGAHTLETAGEGVSRYILPELSEKKYTLDNDIISYENKLKSVERALFNEEESEPLKPGNPVIRWAITGGVLGLLAMIGFWMTKYVVNKSKRIVVSE